MRDAAGISEGDANAWAATGLYGCMSWLSVVHDHSSSLLSVTDLCWKSPSQVYLSGARHMSLSRSDAKGKSLR